MATQDIATDTAGIAEGPREALIVAWIADNLGARVTRIEMQGRWRPAWFVDAERDGERLHLYVRGERTENFLPYGLRREYEVHRCLEQGGIRVPHLYGFIEDLPGSVMDVVPGRPNLGTCDDPQDKDAVLGQLAEQMVAMHALDPQPLVDAGLRLPTEPRDVTLSLFQDFYDNYAARHQRPDPLLEFCAQWVLRNAPEASEPARVIACDAGQFLFDGDTLTAMMDFELSALGDPLMDLAALRIRGQWEDLGDIPAFYRRYEAVSGRPVDMQKVRFNTAAFSLAGALASAICVDQFLEAPSENADYVEYLSWVTWEVKQAIEAIGEYLGIALAATELPEPANTGLDEALFAMGAALESGAGGSAVDEYRHRVRVSIHAHMQLVNAYGPAFEEEYCGDVADLLGRTPQSVAEADRWLEDFVRSAGPDADETLLILLHRRVCRQAWLLAVPGSYYIAGLTEPLKPI